MPAASVSASSGQTLIAVAPASSASYSACSRPAAAAAASATPSGMITIRRTVGSLSRMAASTGQRLASAKMIESPA